LFFLHKISTSQQTTDAIHELDGNKYKKINEMYNQPAYQQHKSANQPTTEEINNPTSYHASKQEQYNKPTNSKNTPINQQTCQQASRTETGTNELSSAHTPSQKAYISN
jgi:hypothetical protein